MAAVRGCVGDETSWRWLRTWAALPPWCHRFLRRGCRLRPLSVRRKPRRDRLAEAAAAGPHRVWRPWAAGGREFVAQYRTGSPLARLAIVSGLGRPLRL